MGFLNLFQDGGFVMYPLLIFSIIIWAVAIEKIWFIKKINKQLKDLFIVSSKLLSENKIDEAKGYSKNLHDLIKIPYITLFDLVSDNDQMKNRENWEHRVGRRLMETAQGLKKYLWILGTIGSSAPFVGLFGTVIGIIKSFDSISQAGKGGFSVVATGLSEALIATASGIIVAVIAVIFFNYFQVKLSAINLKIKNGLEDLSDFL